jgi:hypothetical protein
MVITRVLLIAAFFAATTAPALAAKLDCRCGGKTTAMTAPKCSAGKTPTCLCPQKAGKSPTVQCK